MEYKVVVLGAGSVGKSCLSVQFVRGVFVEQYDPTVEESYRQQIEIDGSSYMLEIIDTAGTENFTTMRNVYVQNGHGFLLVFSITAKSTLTEIEPIIQLILRIKDCDGSEIPIILVGNKADLEEQRDVSKAEATQLIEKFKISKYVETSAKNNMNVKEVFEDVTRMIVSKHAPKKDGKKEADSGKDSKKKGKCTLL
eukprot:TRINITY_DN241_c0_g2_i1.p1 TRINITY_DN241_c0_g2~~TRINITY_DN241_c0_g2_i1.p1  ORF type:complete len:196 (+),score=33.81 TRINITY_DN241_c0_g2_i1:65-652(+)